MQAFENAKEKAAAKPAPVVPIQAEAQQQAIVAEPADEQPLPEESKAVTEPSPSPINEAPLNNIPGLTAADIKLSLQDLGFTCKGPNTFDAPDEYNVSWSCEEKTANHWYFVDWFGRSATKIGAVSATAQDYTSKTPTAEMRQFLGYVASLPYEGASPAEAKTWAEQTAAQAGEGVIGNETIGDVEFCLTKAAQTLNLDIAKDCER